VDSGARDFNSVRLGRRQPIRPTVLALQAEIARFTFVTGVSAKELGLRVFHSPGIVYDILSGRRVPRRATCKRLRDYMRRALGGMSSRSEHYLPYVTTGRARH